MVNDADGRGIHDQRPWKAADGIGRLCAHWYDAAMMMMTHRTIGYHVVKSGHALWMPGDERGHWSEAWDDQIGFIEPHTLHEGDPVRLRMAQERLKHPPVRFTDDMMNVMIDVIGACKSESPWSIVAASIEPTHMHLLITYSGLDIHRTAKWLAQEMTKAVHHRTSHAGPVFCKGNWCEYVFEDSHWRNLIAYIERHNARRGLAARPYAFLSPVHVM